VGVDAQPLPRRSAKRTGSSVENARFRPGPLQPELQPTTPIELKLTVRELTARSSGRRITTIRTLLVSLAVERWRLRPSELAPHFGRRNDVVSRWVRWGAQRRMEDKEFAKLYEKIDRSLSRELGDTPLA